MQKSSTRIIVYLRLCLFPLFFIINSVDNRYFLMFSEFASIEKQTNFLFHNSCYPQTNRFSLRKTKSRNNSSVARSGALDAKKSLSPSSLAGLLLNLLLFLLCRLAGKQNGFSDDINLGSSKKRRFIQLYEFQLS